jgi:hypothetical protein
MTASGKIGHSRPWPKSAIPDPLQSFGAPFVIRFGPNASSQRADVLLDQGDTDGFTAWLKVVKAIETLQRKGPPEGEALN